MKTDSVPVYLFHQGTNYKAYEFLGCHEGIKNKKNGWYFRVWAPKAQAVSLVGDFNCWNDIKNPLTRINDEGIWEIFVSDVVMFDKYKFSIKSDKGKHFLKADPYAFMSETQQLTASIVYDIRGFEWTDSKWIEERKNCDYAKSPMNIYEVHAGSWRKHYSGEHYSYKELADSLVEYVIEMGYTHIEFMPLSEYPLDDSWGYQVTGYYAPTSRYGKPKDLMYLINKCHEKGIGVFLDWVPAHFCKDEQGLMEFDGSALYENPIQNRMEHKGWGTRIFDYARNEVSCFLISNAIFWLNEYHFDGLRADAVASMLYHDYDRKEGDWTPNIYGGKENLEAIEFFKKLSVAIKSYTANGLLIAEESTSFPNITKPSQQGLGFDFKWNMGWMNDILDYAKTDPYFRSYKHNKLTFSMMYAYSEKYILPFSHDEVVHLKKSMLDKMPGDYESKFAGLRTIESYMFAHPGKKLNFMGYEIGQFIEWNQNQELDWFLLTYDMHAKLQSYFKKLNSLYKSYSQFYECDTDWNGFEWLTVDDNYNNIIAFERKNNSNISIIAILNFSNVTHYNYCIGVDKGDYSLLLNSDDVEYGGYGIEIIENPLLIDNPFKNKLQMISLTIPATSALFYICKK
ncbi:MAG: 1,4-alpha-glucan branching protein GlgB [Clostridia bacterium]